MTSLAMENARLYAAVQDAIAMPKAFEDVTSSLILATAHELHASLSAMTTYSDHNHCPVALGEKKAYPSSRTGLGYTDRKPNLRAEPEQQSGWHLIFSPS